MYPEKVHEKVSVVGTDAFMDFVEEIKVEGVDFEYRPMGEHTIPVTPLVIEVDRDNVNKDIDALDIEMPTLTRRVYREYKKLETLDLTLIDFTPVIYQQFRADEQQKIVFNYIASDEESHITEMDNLGNADYRNIITYFAQTIMKELRLVSGYDVLYGKVKDFIHNHLFDAPIDLDSRNTWRNLAEPDTIKILIDTFKQAINDLTLQDIGEAQIYDVIRLQDMRPFMVKEQDCLTAPKTVFNRITGDSELELDFAKFLEDCPDVVSFAKNYIAFSSKFKIDYVNAEGNIADYYPDFFVKLKDGRLIIAETKGWDDPNVDEKMHRLAQWCEDINKVQSCVIYDFVYVDEANYYTYPVRTFQQLLRTFTKYKT